MNLKEKLLSKARLLNLEVSQNSHSKWIIRGYEQGKVWLLEEKEVDIWLITFNQVPQIFLPTEKVINILNRQLIKHSRHSNFLSHLPPGGLGAGSPQEIEKTIQAEQE